MSETYEVFAIQFGHNPRRRRFENFLYHTVDDLHDGLMPMDFYVWVAVSDQRVVLVDTGAPPEHCAKRDVDYIRHPTEGLRALGLTPDRITDIVTTHMHWDHAGNLADFPVGNIHVQQKEIAHVTSSAMAVPFLQRSYEFDQVTAYLQEMYRGRVVTHDGEHEVAPGVTIRLTSGHAQGMQIVRVRTKRGWLVLASDTIHYYENPARLNPFPVFTNSIEYARSWQTVELLADSPDHIVPGHDPLVLSKYPAATAATSGWIARLDAAPSEMSG